MKRRLALSARSTFALAAAAAALCCVAAPREARAQYYGYGPSPAAAYGPFGFRHRVHGYVGGQLTGFAVAAQVTDFTGYMGHGGGGGLFGGIRLGPWFSGELNWLITYHDERYSRAGTTTIFLNSLYLMSFTADAKIHIPTRAPVEPYIQGGVGFAFLGATYSDCLACDALFAKGPAFNLGGGLDVWLGPWFSLGGRILYRGIYFTEDALGRQLSRSASNFVNGVTLDVNATFHF